MRVALVDSVLMVLYEPAISTGRHFASLPLHNTGFTRPRLAASANE
jgi:hypothetical protein